MEGIIGWRVLSDICIPFIGISIIGEELYLSNAYIIKVRLLFYNLVPVDFDTSQAIDERIYIKQIHIGLWQRREKFLTHRLA